MSESRRGIVLGVVAYLLWGGFPIYFALLAPAGAFEILAHRIVWSAVVMLVLCGWLGRSSAVREIVRDPRRRRLLAIAAVTITINWGTYIYGVSHGRVVETSLGYFVNPLVTVLLGVVVLGERLRRAQAAALGLAAVAVVVLTAAYGRPPYLALVLACSFGTYGLVKKQADVGAVESLTFETTLIAPVALVFLVVAAATGHSTFTSHGLVHPLLLASAGIVTAIPLLCFGGAAIRVPLVTLGLLQYLAPILQFALGIAYFGEHMPASRWVGFVLVWIALALLTAEALRHQRSLGRQASPTDLAPVSA